MINQTDPVIYRLTCRGCGSRHLEPLFSLGNLALCNTFIKSADEEIHIPLDLIICDVKRGGCGLLQLRHTTPPDLMYRQYWYKSGISEMMRAHLAALTARATQLARPRKGDIVLDIGCNDGTTLRSYEADVMRVGFEPNQLHKEAQKGTDLIINDFFGAEAFRRELGEKMAKIVTSIAMFYDLEDPNRFIADVKSILAKDGLWIVEMHYLPAMLEDNGFDAIVHEHVTYYSLQSLNRLLEQHDLTVFDIDFNEMNGGSFRAYVCHNGAAATADKGAQSRIAKVRRYEQRLGVDDPKTYARFFKRITMLGRQLRTALSEIKRRGETAYVYGASTKGNALLQFWNIDRTLIKAAADKNADKWGLQTPGSRIPIVSPEAASRAKPDYFLVLIWHLIDEVADQWRDFLKGGGKLIAPLPKVRKIDARSKKRSVTPGHVSSWRRM
jgi:hypothetical protein